MSADLYGGRVIVPCRSGGMAVVDRAGRVLRTGSYRECLAVLEPHLAGCGESMRSSGSSDAGRAPRQGEEGR